MADNKFQTPEALAPLPSRQAACRRCSAGKWKI